MVRFVNCLLFFLIQFLIKKAEGFPSAFAMSTDDPAYQPFMLRLDALRGLTFLFGFTCNLGDAMLILLKQLPASRLNAFNRAATSLRFPA